MMRVSSLLKELVISPSEPLRNTMARSGRPEDFMALRNPSAMERTPTKTATTPAIPKTAAAAAPLRSGTLRRLNLVMVRIWEIRLRMGIE